MSKIVIKNLRFLPSETIDTVEHRIRIQTSATASSGFSYDLPYHAVAFNRSTYVAGTKVVINLTDIFSQEVISGIYSVYVTAADAVGNESDPFEIANASLDFVAPKAPTQAVIG